MEIFSFLSSIFKPLAAIVDSVHTSDEELGKLKNEASKIQAKVGEKFLNYERQLLTAQTNIIVAEASGGSWLKQSWRPVTMLVFLGLVVCDSFNLLANPLAPEAWTLLQLGLGGYVAGRSGEKISKIFKK